MLSRAKRTRVGGASLGQDKRGTFPDDQNPPHLIMDDSSDDDRDDKNDKKLWNKKNHHRGASQQLRLFLLTGRSGISILTVQSLLAAIILAAIFTLYYQHHQATTSWIPHLDHLEVLSQAGFSAKPRMVAAYFKDVPSHSFTHVVHAIKPPPTSDEWHKMLHYQLEEQMQHQQDQHHHHHHERRLVLEIPGDPMLSDSSHKEIQKHIQDDSKDYEQRKPRLTENPDACTPQHEWQITSYPVCNQLHEHSMMGDRLFQESIVNPRIFRSKHDHHEDGNHHPSHHHHQQQQQLLQQDKQQQLQLRRKLLEKTTQSITKPTQFRLLAHGYWRDTWRMSLAGGDPRQEQQSSQPLAFKTMRYEHDVDEYILDKQRRDALTSARLQFSEQTVKMYAYCGTSALYEYAPGGDLYKLVEQFKKGEDWASYYSSEERFLLAYNVTVALADLHNTEPGGQPTAIVHGDFNAQQFVAVTEPQEDDDPTKNNDRHHHHHSTSHKLPHFKLGDFNLARFVYWNQKHNHPCVIRPDGRGGEFRAPEEYAKDNGRTEKVDIYSLGNLLYTIVTGHWPFDELDHPHGMKEVKELVKQGRRPHIDSAILQSNDEYVQAMLHAIHMCWPQDPHERATARDVEVYLEQHLPQSHHHHGGRRLHHHHHPEGNNQQHQHHQHPQAEKEAHNMHRRHLHHQHQEIGLR